MRGVLKTWVAAMALAATTWAGDWTTLDNAFLLPNMANDGDSFHVRHGTREYIFRLYFVDCGEIENRFPERVAEQAAAWGIPEDDVLQAGRAAAAFTRQALGSRPLRIDTQWEDAKGSSEMTRYFAFVTVGGKDLGELLVAEGLARVYGNQVDSPRGEPRSAIAQRLDELARQAKARRRGVWAATIDAPTVSAEDAAIAAQAPVGESWRQPAPEAGVERQVTTAQSVTAYTLQPPYRPIGTFQPGTSLAILRALGEGMIHVRHTANGGKVTHAACKAWELGVPME